MKNGTFSKQQVVGKDTLGKLMSNLSKLLNLSEKYTNHCIRVTAINIMHEAGMSNDEISFNTGHKNSSSVQRYLRKNHKNLIKACDALSVCKICSKPYLF